MAASARIAHLDLSDARQRVLDVLRELLEELGSRGALPALAPGSHLERDLGLGSLERVELMSRLETAFAVRLPESVVNEANTPEEICEAIARFRERETPGAPVRARLCEQPLRRRRSIEPRNPARASASRPPRPCSTFSATAQHVTRTVCTSVSRTRRAARPL